MKDILRPILELLVVLPGLLLGYFPVKTYLKQSPGRLAAWLFPLMACLCIGSGLACYRLGGSTFLALAGVALAAICLYTRTLTISLWKSGTIALSVCAVFACVNSLSRAVSAAIIRNLQLPPDGPWLCLGACVFYNAVCWVIVLAAYYPATHTVRAMVEDDNFAQTWYVFAMRSCSRKTSFFRCSSSAMKTSGPPSRKRGRHGTICATNSIKFLRWPRQVTWRT